jgi:tetrahydromethanopterin S-methyltransferase subunit F
VTPARHSGLMVGLALAAVLVWILAVAGVL